MGPVSVLDVMRPVFCQACGPPMYWFPATSLMLLVRTAWIATLQREKLLGGKSFNLDFHTIPYFGEDEFVEHHYLSKRSRSQKSILVFLAQDADSQVFCYANADIRKGEEAQEVSFREPLRRGFADARRSAGNERDLYLDLGHDLLLTTAPVPIVL